MFGRTVKYIYTGQIDDYKVYRYDDTKNNTDNDKSNTENYTETKSDTDKTTKENENE